MSSLLRTAQKLGRNTARARRDKDLPRLWLFTDPVRTPDPLAAAGALPRGAAVGYRAFAAENAADVAHRLRKLTRERGLLLLIGADARLAARVGADGVHLPERAGHRVRAIRRPGWLVTVAAHGAAALYRGQAADAIVLSAVFPSRSPSAGRPLGPIRFALLARRSRKPVIALGGVTMKNAPRLISTGAAGLAAIDGLAPDGG